MAKAFDFWRDGCARRVNSIHANHLDADARALVIAAAIKLLESGETKSPVDAVDQAADKYFEEHEEVEFVNLLKFFVSAAPPKIDHLNVVLKQGKTFRLIGDDGLAIKSEYLEGLVDDMNVVESAVDYADLLISALITLSPSKITVHKAVDATDQVIVNRVFEDRVTTCTGCNLCTPKESTDIK